MPPSWDIVQAVAALQPAGAMHCSTLTSIDNDISGTAALAQPAVLISRPPAMEEVPPETQQPSCESAMSQDVPAALATDPAIWHGARAVACDGQDQVVAATSILEQLPRALRDKVAALENVPAALDMGSALRCGEF